MEEKSRLIFRERSGYSACLQEKYYIFSLRNCKWWTRPNDSPQANLSRHNAHVLSSLPSLRGVWVMKRTALLQTGISQPQLCPSIWFGAWITPMGENISCALNVESFLAASAPSPMHMHTIYFPRTGRKTNTLEFFKLSGNTSKLLT